MKGRTIKPTIFAALFFFAGLSSLQAQNIPPGETSGAEQERFRQEEERRKLEAEFIAEKSKEKATVEEPQTAVPPVYSGPIFRMNDVAIIGNEKISDEEIRPLVGKLLNRDVNLTEVQEVVSEIKQLYRSRGFIATYVFVPPQKTKQGVIEIRIAEGKLGQMEATGNKWVSKKVISRRVQIEPGQVIEYKNLTSQIARLNANRDIKAKAVLKPGVQEGTTDVEVQVKDHFPVHLSTDVNNLGTDNTGKTRWGVNLLNTNLLGQLDQASVRYQLGKNSWALGSDYNIPISKKDTRLGFSYQHSAVDLGGPFKALKIKGSANTYTPYITHPININDRLKAEINSGFDFKEIENRALGRRISRDSLRILNLGLRLNENDMLGLTALQNSFHFGFPSFLGASDKSETSASRPGTGGQFFIYRQSIFRYFGLAAGTGLALRSALQLSSRALPPSEQFRLGGAYSIRGYPEGEFLSDYGGTLSAELLVPTYFFQKDWKLPFSKESLRQQLKGILFFDFGAGNSRRTLASESNSRALAGMGIGMRLHLFDRVFARIEWAKPLGSQPKDGSTSSFNFGISAEIL